MFNTGAKIADASICQFASFPPFWVVLMYAVLKFALVGTCLQC